MLGYIFKTTVYILINFDTYRLYIKDFGQKVMRYIYELDDIMNFINVDILLVNFLF